MAGMFPENKEVEVFGKRVRFPGVNAEGKFTNGDFTNPDVPPSYLDADTLNLIIDNLNSLIAHLGGEANNTGADQLARLFASAAEKNRAVKRDAFGRAKVAAPAEEDDIARKKEIDDIINGAVELKKLTVLGDIIQKGANKITHAEDVYTKQDMVHLREGAQSALSPGELAGITAELYDGKSAGVLGFDRDGTARVGDEGDTQPLATRAESSQMADGAPVIWNGAASRLETQGGIRVTVTTSFNTGAIGYDKTILITAGAPIILTLGNGAYAGIEVKIINATDREHTIRGTTARDADSVLMARQIQTIIWNGSKWEGKSCPRLKEVYVQFPQQDSPQNLFICTKWTEISYSGAFFRASGGNAAAFIEKSGVLSKQAGNIQAHNHKMNHDHGSTGDMSDNSSGYTGVGDRNGNGAIRCTGPFSYKRYVNGNIRQFAPSTNADEYCLFMNIAHSHTVPKYSGNTADAGGSETRPENYTIRVWKRTA